MPYASELAPIDLNREFKHQAKVWRDNEPVTSAFWGATLEAAQTGPIAESLQEVTTTHAIKNPDATAPFIAGIIRTAYRAYLEESDPDFDIQTLTTKESWKAPLGQVAVALHEEAEGRGDQHSANLITNLWTGRVQTTIPQRYATDELILQVTRERFPYGVHALDIGSGIGLGPLAMMDEQARKRLRFQQVYNPAQPFCDPERRRQPLEITNSLLARPSILNSYVCVDIATVYHEARSAYENGIIAWSKASRRPSEAKDDLIDTLTNNKPDNVCFRQANLANAKEFTKFEDWLDGRKIDFITWNTTAHQMKPDERAAMFYNLKSILSPVGIIKLKDFATLQRRRSLLPQDITDIRMLQRWHMPLSFRDFIYDSALPQRMRGMEHAFSFNDSRCEELTIALAHIAINGEPVPIHEAIRLAAAA